MRFTASTRPRTGCSSCLTSSAAPSASSAQPLRILRPALLRPRAPASSAAPLSFSAAPSPNTASALSTSPPAKHAFFQLIADYSSGDCRSAYNTLEVAAQLVADDKRITKAIAASVPRPHVRQVRRGHRPAVCATPIPCSPHVRRRRGPARRPAALSAWPLRTSAWPARGPQPHPLRQRSRSISARAARSALAEAVVVALAPKSNSVYTAYGAVQQEIEQTRQEPVPLHFPRNAP